MKIAAKLHHIGFPTTDMEATVGFYESLGGKVVFEKADVDEGRPIQVKIIDFHGALIECYERRESPMRAGAIDHLAFSVGDVDGLYKICKERGYRFMDECAGDVGNSTYWPKPLKWFIVCGPNEEKIEFCRES
ncbi:MAG: hypothetical protein GX592_03700 [Clostridiales bacterium]|nr:hypothetical protein [Clostridiales bacterium]